MKCENTKCKMPFVPNQVVWVTQAKDGILVHCCSEQCRMDVEKRLRPDDLLPHASKHQLAKYQVREISIAGANIHAVPIRMKDGAPECILQLEIPTGGISIDELLTFDRSCRLTLAETDIVDYKSETAPVSEAEAEKAAIDHGLNTALMQNDGAAARWGGRSILPMTDKDLKAVIAEEFGMRGEATLDDGTTVHFEGGADPAFWYNVAPSEPPTLSGRKLVKMVRAIYSIPKPESKAAKKAS